MMNKDFHSVGPLEIVFSFDMTVSMSECREEVKCRLQDLIQRLQGDIPGIKIAVFAHGDYDSEGGWITKWVDFTTNVAELCQFVQAIQENIGYTSPECYELALRQVRTQLSWTPGSRRCLVLFGDEIPHEADFPDNKDNIDWRQETRELATRGVTIYGVQCKNNLYARDFYETISSVSGGKYLTLQDSGNLFDLLMAVSYKESNETAMLAAYEKEVRARQGHAGICSEVQNVFAALHANAARDEYGDFSSSPSPKIRTAPKVVSASSATSHSKAARKPPTHPTPRTPRRREERKSKRSSLLLHKTRLPLLKRENVYEKNFLLGRLKWSPWILVLSPEKPDGQGTLWEKRQGPGQTGFRLNVIKRKDDKVKVTNGRCKVLFEVAVRTPRSGRQRHVVYSSFSMRCLHNASWERCLLGVRNQLERVLREGCHVYLRYNVIGTRTEKMSSLRRSLDRYDYAWKKLYGIRNDSRDVTKGRFSISVSGRN